MILFSSEIFVVLLLWLRHLLVTLLTAIVFKSTSAEPPLPALVNGIPREKKSWSDIKSEYTPLDFTSFFEVMVLVLPGDYWIE